MFSASAPRPTAGFGGWIAIVVLALLAPFHAGVAYGDVVLRWRPSSDPTIVGYNVYVRAAGSTYSSPRRAGLPGRAADGTHSFRLTQLPSAPTLYFAVTGYRADGSESGLSNEIAVGPTDACVIDSCYAPGSCSVYGLPDGSRCAPPGTDPCGSICSASVCGGATRAGLATRRLALVQSTRGVRLGAVGVVLGAAGTNLAATGVSLTVEGIDATSIFQTSVPGGAFRANATGTAFRYQAPGGTTTGLLRLTFRHTGDDYRLAVRAVLPGLTSDLVPDQLRWVVEMGAQCAGDGALACARNADGVSCS